MRPKLTIVNETKWSTRDLRRILVRVAREEFDGSTPNRAPRPLRVKITYSRSGRLSGYAFYHSGSSVIRVPAPHRVKRFPSGDFAKVSGHEFGHNLGISHRNMKAHYKWGAYATEHYAWADAIEVRSTVPATVPHATRVRATRERKVKEAEAKVAEWGRKLTLAKTKLKGWERKLADRRKRLAAPVAESPRAPEVAS